MLGFYPPVWNRSLLWQPIPYEISDPLLRMYNVPKCQEYTDSYKAISEDTGKGADTWLKKNPELVNYIAEKSGLNASLSDLADVADNIGNMVGGVTNRKSPDSSRMTSSRFPLVEALQRSTAGLGDQSYPQRIHWPTNDSRHHVIRRSSSDPVR